jgi:hypothetical protein
VLALPLKLRRWSGYTSSGTDSRLIVRDAMGERVGTVALGSDILFLEGWAEPLRPQAVESLAQVGVNLAGPSAETLRRMECSDGLAIPPSSGLFNVHGRWPGPVAHVEAYGKFWVCARFWPNINGSGVDALDTLYLDDRVGFTRIATFLERYGLLAPDGDVVPYSPVMMDGRPPLTVEAMEWQRVYGSRPVTTASPRNCEDEPDWGDTASACDFSTLARLLPEALVDRGETYLREIHRRSHREKQSSAWWAAQEGQPPDENYRAGGYWDFVAPSSARRQAGRYNDERGEPFLWIAKIWPDGIDDEIDGLIELYGGYFAVVAAVRARSLHRDLWAAAEARWTAFKRPIGSFHIGGLGVDSPIVCVLAGAIWNQTRYRRDWPTDSIRECAVCKEPFEPWKTPLENVIETGPPRYCVTCTDAIWYSGDEFDVPEEQEAWPCAPSAEIAEAALLHLASLVGVPTATKGIRGPILQDGDQAARDYEIAARVAAPRQFELRAIDAGLSWTHWLARCGVLGESHRTARGVVSTAEDGHLCRSMFERTVDDFLFRMGIDHSVEPDYPWHPVLNATGRRADWLLTGEVFVEAAGMMSVEAYRAKMQFKRTLAAECGFELIILEPRDLPRLAQIFERFLPGASVMPGIADTHAPIRPH